MTPSLNCWASEVISGSVGGALCPAEHGRGIEQAMSAALTGSKPGI
jgi:hypothetical protein